MVISSPELATKQNENSETKAIEWQAKEWMKCKKSFLFFLQNYVKLQDRNRERTLSWESWPYLVWLAECLTAYPQLIIGKARQLGVSWLVCAYAYWKVKFSENVKVLMLSQKEDPEAYDLIDKCRFIDDNLPEWMRSKREPDQRATIGIPATKGVLRALASTETAGRSTDATLVICDEWEYHPYSEKNFGALRPTLSGGGQFIALSTTDPMISADKSFFKQKYIQAKTGDSGFTPIFLPWHIRPGRDKEWFKRETRDMPAWQTQGEYPATEDEMLATLLTRKFFNENAISAMYEDCRKPMEHELSDKHPSIKIYRPPEVGKKYLIFNDPSEGRDDPHAIIVTDATGEQVAESHGKTTADLCGQIHDELARLYNSAFNCYESGPGGAGGIVAEKLKELGTPNVCVSLNISHRPFVLDNVSGKKGWWASKAYWDVSIWELEEAVRLRKVVPRNKECLDEFLQFIVPEGKDPQKTRGGHDDYIDAWRGVVMLRKYLRTEVGEVKSYPYGR